jgi:hypothetical protein
MHAVPLPDLPLYHSTLFTPRYRDFNGKRWCLRHADMVLCLGYWSPPQLVMGMALLSRIDDAGQTHTWMSMSPMEIESQEIGCQHASGRVVVMGLGMGWAAANAALHPAVTQVTVVEFDPEVIDAVRQSGLFEQLPPEARARVQVIQGDAHQYRPDTPADTLLADIWLPLFGAERDAEVRQMQANTGARRVYFWGQEMVIAHRLRQAGWPLNADTVAQTVAAMGLPLIGPAECADYVQRIELAAARWLKS